MRSIPGILILFLTLLGALSVPGEQPVELTPVEFKALTLAKTPPYIQWPDSAFTGSESNLVIGVLGKDPFGGLLQNLVKGQQIKNRDIVVKVFESPSQFTHCQILFVPAEAQADWLELFKTIDSNGVLTVGETEDFIKSGGIFNLSVKERKLEINLRNAKKAGLTIDSRLLKIARVTR